jgi:hypothetical protein
MPIAQFAADDFKRPKIPAEPTKEELKIGD